MSAESYLLLAIAVLVIALVIAIAYGRIDACDAERFAGQLAAERVKNRHLGSLVAGYRSDLARLSARCGDQQARIAELLDERAAATTGEPSLTESVYADLASLPITDPKDQR